MAEQSSGSGPFRAMVFLAMAAILGALSLVVLFQLINSYQERIAEARKPEDTVMVIVAARDLYQGVTITEEDLYAVEIPPRYLPEGVFLSPEHVVGRIPRERILANEFIRNDRLADPESGVGLNAVIPRGMRAISVNIDQGSAMSGFLNPGNYVDMLVTIESDTTNKAKTETRTLLQAVFVLGVNSRMGSETAEEAVSKRGKRQPSVTLLVTADQAEAIALASMTGRIRLTLRNDLDVNYAEVSGVDVDALRRKLEKPKVVRKAAPAPPPEPTHELKIIRGNNVEETKANADGTLRK